MISSGQGTVHQKVRVLARVSGRQELLHIAHVPFHSSHPHAFVPMPPIRPMRPSSCVLLRRFARGSSRASWPFWLGSIVDPGEGLNRTLIGRSVHPPMGARKRPPPGPLPLGQGRRPKGGDLRRDSERAIRTTATQLPTHLFQRDRRTSCLEEEREERDWEKVEPNVIGRCCETISRESPNPPFVVWPGVEVSNASRDSSTKKHVES